MSSTTAPDPPISTPTATSTTTTSQTATAPDPPTSVPTPIPSSNPDDTAVPISPIARQTSFPHHTLAAAATHPFIDTATPSINAHPVELDGTPTSPENVVRKEAVEDGGSGSPTQTQGRRKGLGVETGDGVGVGLDGGEDDEMFSPEGEDEVTEGLREKRAALLASRSKDPAVLVDIPSTPGPVEYEFADKQAGPSQKPAASAAKTTAEPADAKAGAQEKVGDASEA